MKKTIVWEGRFQPVHKGHLEYIRRLLQEGGEALVYAKSLMMFSKRLFSRQRLTTILKFAFFL